MLMDADLRKTSPQVGLATRAQGELIATRREVALGKVRAFDRECVRLAELVRAGTIDKADAIDTLAEAADANNLSETFGASLIQFFMADAFDGTALPSYLRRRLHECDAGAQH